MKRSVVPRTCRLSRKKIPNSLDNHLGKKKRETTRGGIENIHFEDGALARRGAKI